MKKTVGFFLGLVLSFSGYSATDAWPLGLDTIVFQLSAKQWVNTQTALLSVTINATLSNADLVKARADIMQNLANIAAGEWHLSVFDRSQDSSGLEKLYVEAQARVPQNVLTKVYQNAKGVSKPGATYDIGAVEFKPSLDEMQQGRASLREKLYQEISLELARINKIYVSQNYSVSNVDFTDGDGKFVLLKNASGVSDRANAMNTMAMPTPVIVGNELTMTAIVAVASNRLPKAG